MLYSPFTREYIQKVLDKSSHYEQDFRDLAIESQADRKIDKTTDLAMVYQGNFISPDQAKLFEKISRLVARIGRKLTNEFVANPDFRALFQFKPEEEALMKIDPGYKMPVSMARLDLFYRDGKDFLLEQVHTDQVSGIYSDQVLGEILKTSSILKRMGEEWEVQSFDLFEGLVDSMANHYRRIVGKLPMNIAIVASEDGLESEACSYFHKTFEKKGYNCITCQPWEMTYEDDTLWGRDHITEEKSPVDLVYRQFSFQDFLNHLDEGQDFLEAYKNQAFILFNSLRSEFLNSPRLFSILHREETKDLLTENEWAFIQDHVPTSQPDPDRSPCLFWTDLGFESHDLPTRQGLFIFGEHYAGSLGQVDQEEDGQERDWSLVYPSFLVEKKED